MQERKPNKPFSQACENNKKPIFSVLEKWLPKQDIDLLEIGSGTGQHAVYFGQNLPHVTWQTSDLEVNHVAINQWIDAEQVQGRCENVKNPIILNVTEDWPNQAFDVVFTANTLHIMSWSCVEQLFNRVTQCMKQMALLFVYGPFNYQGQFTSTSNAEFHRYLQQQNPVSGIRDFEQVNQLALESSLILQQDNAMPANNRLIIWKKN